MSSSVQVDPTTGEITKRQTSVWLPVETFDEAALLARKWRLPPSRFFSQVVQRAIAEALEREEAKEREAFGRAEAPETSEVGDGAG